MPDLDTLSTSASTLPSKLPKISFFSCVLLRRSPWFCDVPNSENVLSGPSRVFVGDESMSTGDLRPIFVGDEARCGVRPGPVSLGQNLRLCGAFRDSWGLCGEYVGMNQEMVIESGM